MTAGAVLIVGAGIDGLCSAIALARNGRAVEVVDPNPAPVVVGRSAGTSGEEPGRTSGGPGIALAGNAIRALDALGVADRCITTGFPFDTTGTHRQDGTLLRAVTVGPNPGPGLPPMLGILRDDLLGVLLEAAVEQGASVAVPRAVTAFSQHADRVEVTFADGSWSEYDCVIAADGIRSATRRMALGEVAQPVGTGQSSWRYVLPRLDGLDGSHLYLAADGSKAGLVPLRDDLMDVFLNLNESQLPTDPSLDVQFRDHLAPFGGLIADVREAIRDADRVHWRPYEVVDVPSPWFSGRVIVIGDAAHATTSHLKQGEALAIEDAVVLGAELGKDRHVEEAFAAFMHRRYERCRFLTGASLKICQWELGQVPNVDREELLAMAHTRMSEAI